MMWLVFILFLIIIFSIILYELKHIKKIYIKSSLTDMEIIYIKKEFMTDCEKRFYNVLKELEKDYRVVIHPQVNLASIIKKSGNYKFENELFRNIDFGIFKEDYSDIIGLIEINDKSHYRKDRKNRDEKVKYILNKAGINILTYHTEYSNTRDYIKNRIIKNYNLENLKRDS